MGQRLAGIVACSSCDRAPLDSVLRRINECGYPVKVVSISVPIAMVSAANFEIFNILILRQGLDVLITPLVPQVVDKLIDRVKVSRKGLRPPIKSSSLAWDRIAKHTEAVVDTARPRVVHEVLSESSRNELLCPLLVNGVSSVVTRSC